MIVLLVVLERARFDAFVILEMGMMRRNMIQNRRSTPKSCDRYADTLR